MALFAGALVALTLPPSKVHGDLPSKMKAIDYYGVVFSSSAILLLLIPISGGGTYFEWSSPMVISMVTLGSICMVLFVVVEWKFAVMPMMPLRLLYVSSVSTYFVFLVQKVIPVSLTSLPVKILPFVLS